MTKRLGTFVEFTATLGGDGECFAWEQLSQKELVRISGDPVADVLYPDAVMRFLGCEFAKRYRFTITAEAVEW